MYSTKYTVKKAQIQNRPKKKHVDKMQNKYISNQNKCE